LAWIDVTLAFLSDSFLKIFPEQDQSGSNGLLSKRNANWGKVGDDCPHLLNE
jgi:hypothetical protein